MQTESAAFATFLSSARLCVLSTTCPASFALIAAGLISLSEKVPVAAAPSAEMPA